MYLEEDVNVVMFYIFRYNIATLFDGVFKHDDAGVNPNNDVYSGSIGSIRNIDIFIKYLLSMGIVQIGFHKNLMCHDDYNKDIYLPPEENYPISPIIELITNIIDVIVSEI